MMIKTIIITGMIFILFSIEYCEGKNEDKFMLYVIKITGPLKRDEFYTARYAMLYYEYKWNKNVSLFEDYEWNFAVKNAAKRAKTKSLNSIVHIEKWGEKFLKTTIQLTRKSLEGLDKFIGEKMGETEASRHTDKE